MKPVYSHSLRYNSFNNKTAGKQNRGWSGKTVVWPAQSRRIQFEGVQKVFGTLDLFVSLLETEIKYPILQGGILPFWTPSFLSYFIYGTIFHITEVFVHDSKVMIEIPYELGSYYI